jgi:exodeoxyribonuclease VII large subunit
MNELPFADESSSTSPRAPRVRSVTEVTQEVRELLESGMGVVWVEGEISNYRKQSSGHQYFTLKDSQCQLACVLFARQGQWRKPVPLSDGMHVQLRGSITVYEARGQYQLNVQIVQPAGAGLLQAKFEALKRKLEAEGLFEKARKKVVPPFPTLVSIVTSPTGAALRDMLNILDRRAPWLRLMISPVRVQGEGAAREIAAAIVQLNESPNNGLPRPDVIVVARGGGSAEDLWQFNEELLARTIAASEIPVVSAVGHEIDFTIADFVADLRAPTPSAAAEIIVPAREELLRRITLFAARTRRCVTVSLERYQVRTASLARSALFSEPRRRLDEAAQRVDALTDSLGYEVRAQIEMRAHRVANSFAALREHRPDQVLGLGRQRLAALQRQLGECARRRLKERRQKIVRVDEMLRLLAPETALARGFSITTLRDGTIVDSVYDAPPGTPIRTRVRDGEIDSTVSSTVRRE